MSEIITDSNEELIREVSKLNIVTSEQLDEIIDKSSYGIIRFTNNSAIAGIMHNTVLKDLETKYSYCVYELSDHLPPKLLLSSKSFKEKNDAISFMNSSVYDHVVISKSNEILSIIDINKLDLDSPDFPTFINKKGLIEVQYAKVYNSNIYGALYKDKFALYIDKHSSSTPNKVIYSGECSYESFSLKNYAKSQFKREMLGIITDRVLKESVMSKPKF